MLVVVAVAVWLSSPSVKVLSNKIGGIANCFRTQSAAITERGRGAGKGGRDRKQRFFQGSHPHHKLAEDRPRRNARANADMSRKVVKFFGRESIHHRLRQPFQPVQCPWNPLPLLLLLRLRCQC